jgi:CRISPR/Cas system CSM-associated protein Csm3 (group 7 of RAMP superfamily)
MNPYDFVSLPDRVRREPVTTHEKFRGLSGRMSCRLTAIAPLFIPQTQAGAGTQQFMTSRYNGRDLPVIPGSSLKGVIRCVAEAVSESCIGLSGELFERGDVSPKYRGDIKPDFRTCAELSNLCPACRMFGMVSSKSHFLGKVSLSDARTEVGSFLVGAPMILKPLMEPKPRHTAFYRPDGNGKIAGRKFYFHHSGPPKTTNQATQFTKTVIPLEGLDAQGNPRTIFEFDVTFNNLADDEYSLLVFGLILTEDMRHKVGGGKPLGLGTVKIEITEILETDPNQRYRGLSARSAGETASAVLAGDALRSHLQAATAPITNTASTSLDDLQYIWGYPPPEGEDYVYPDQEWFNHNSEKPLSETP